MQILYYFILIYYYFSPCGGELEYLHRRPASRRRRKGNPVYDWTTVSLKDIKRKTDDLAL
jgi:hypothetical protein